MYAFLRYMLRVRHLVFIYSFGEINLSLIFNIRKHELNGNREGTHSGYEIRLDIITIRF